MMMMMMMIMMMMMKKKGKKAEQEERERARAEPKLSVLTWVYEHTLMSWLWGRFCLLLLPGSQAPRLPGSQAPRLPGSQAPTTLPTSLMPDSVASPRLACLICACELPLGYTLGDRR